MFCLMKWIRYFSSIRLCPAHFPDYLIYGALLIIKIMIEGKLYSSL